MSAIKETVAIIGGGISGLGAAYLLRERYDVSLFEANDYAGGHSRTITIDGIGEDGDAVAVDTGFIVFNKRNYPNLCGMFDHLNIAHEKSDMSFGVDIANGWLEYSSSAMGQLKNLIRPKYLGMIADILKFNKRALSYIDAAPDITLGQCLDDLNMGAWFKDYYLRAMGAAIWSNSIDTIEQFPAASFIRFFKNHGLLSVNDQPQWYTVTGGSAQYVAVLANILGDRVRLNDAVMHVQFDNGKHYLQTKSGYAAKFDHVVFACHADQAMEILMTPSAAQSNVIGAFRYQENSVILHADRSFMPKTEACWASWVYLSEGKRDEKDAVSLSYWMNNLQNLKTKAPLLVTLNPGRRPDESIIYDEHSFTHPIFDQAAVEAQGRIEGIQGQDNIWFCGAYQRYGFHEDGLWSAVRVAEGLGADIPWT